MFTVSPLTATLPAMPVPRGMRISVVANPSATFVQSSCFSRSTRYREERSAGSNRGAGAPPPVARALAVEPGVLQSGGGLQGKGREELRVPDAERAAGLVAGL